MKAAIEANNRNDGAGRLGEGDEVAAGAHRGQHPTQDDLRAIVVKRDGHGGAPGRCGEVRIEGSVTRYGVVTKDGRGEAVEGLVLGLAGANAQKVVEGVTREAGGAQAHPARAWRSRSSTTAPRWSRRRWARCRRR
jgi:cobalt-zinc-cadmium resistance protein CzcA